MQILLANKCFLCLHVSKNQAAIVYTGKCNVKLQAMPHVMFQNIFFWGGVLWVYSISFHIVNFQNYHIYLMCDSLNKRRDTMQYNNKFMHSAIQPKQYKSAVL